MKTHMVLNHPRKNSNEQGFASIIVALTLIIILSLITVGFAQLMRREQNNALNKQLSTQAFYAAESGVNDAKIDIKAGLTSKTDCTIPASGALSHNQVDPDTSHHVSYTCVLIDTQPGNLSQNDIGSDTTEDSNTNSWTITAAITGGVTADSLNFNWQRSKGTNNYPATLGQFLPHDAWNTTQSAANDNTDQRYTPVLAVSITPLGSGLTRASLTTSTKTYFLYPASAAGSSGNILSGNCNDTDKCNASINPGGGGPYLIHVVSLYGASNVIISASAGGSSLTFTKTQAIIDVTGKAQDVLRRIRVVYSLQQDVALPSNAIEVRDMCKRLALSQTSSQSQQYSLSTNPAVITDTSSSPCNVEYDPPPAP